MILAFHVPPLHSGQGLCYIGRVQLGVPQKIFKKWRILVRWNQPDFSSNGKTRIVDLTLSYPDSPFFYFAEVLLTILYRYNIVLARWLVKAHEMLKPLNLSYYRLYQFQSRGFPYRSLDTISIVLYYQPDIFDFNPFLVLFGRLQRPV